METYKKSFFSAKNIAYFAVLVALVVVLQCLGGYFKVGATSLSFVLVPIVLGGILLGISAGALLGFIFGLIVLIYGITGADQFTYLLFNAQPFLTSALCLVKGTMAGIVSGILYKLISKKQKYVAVFVAAAAAPFVNTGLFIIGAFCMAPTMAELFGVEGQGLVYFLFITCAGINFLVELAINLIFSPALYTVEKIVDKRLKANSK